MGSIRETPQIARAFAPVTEARNRGKSRALKRLGYQIRFREAPGQEGLIFYKYFVRAVLPMKHCVCGCRPARSSSVLQSSNEDRVGFCPDPISGIERK